MVVRDDKGARYTHKNGDQVDGKTAELRILRADSGIHPLGSGADINYVFLVKPNMAIVDANAAFAETHRSGVLVEQLTVASIARTLAANLPGTIQIKILIEGKERETLAGHADLADFYNTAAGDQFPVAE